MAWVARAGSDCSWDRGERVLTDRSLWTGVTPFTYTTHTRRARFAFPTKSRRKAIAYSSTRLIAQCFATSTPRRRCAFSKRADSPRPRLLLFLFSFVFTFSFFSCTRPGIRGPRMWRSCSRKGRHTPGNKVHYVSLPKENCAWIRQGQGLFLF